MENYFKTPVVQNITAAFDWETALPNFRRFRQSLPRPKIESIIDAVYDSVDSLNVAEKCKDGKKVAITAGSRGISQIPEILRLIVNRIKHYGGSPIIVPEMGSHGGATANGQQSLLAELGIVEDVIKAPIISSMSQACGAHLAPGRAESAQETAQTGQIVAERRFLPAAEAGIS